MGRLTRHDRIAVGLIEWGSGSLRDLPWRRTRNPWRILVSEVMLQQTSVARVLPKFEDFIAQYPSPDELSRAPLGEALRLWSGLGYPRRCRNLKSAAEQITTMHNGRVPETIEELLALPGVGQYTARAVLAFAYGVDVGVVDTNVSRVLSRIEGRAMSARELQQLADVLVPSGLGWEWNQVIMDFGARRCTARAPECAGCPVRRDCAWAGRGEDPAASSAGASRPQGRFDGSDRQARGRALRCVADGVRRHAEVIAAMQMDDDVMRATRIINDLVGESLLMRTDDGLSLP